MLRNLVHLRLKNMVSLRQNETLSKVAFGLPFNNRLPQNRGCEPRLIYRHSSSHVASKSSRDYNYSLKEHARFNLQILRLPDISHTPN